MCSSTAPWVIHMGVASWMMALMGIEHDCSNNGYRIYLDRKTETHGRFRYVRPCSNIKHSAACRVLLPNRWRRNFRHCRQSAPSTKRFRSSVNCVINISKNVFVIFPFFNTYYYDNGRTNIMDILIIIEYQCFYTS